MAVAIDPLGLRVIVDSLMVACVLSSEGLRWLYSVKLLDCDALHKGLTLTAPVSSSASFEEDASLCLSHWYRNEGFGGCRRDKGLYGCAE